MNNQTYNTLDFLNYDFPYFKRQELPVTDHYLLGYFQCLPLQTFVSYDMGFFTTSYCSDQSASPPSLQDFRQPLPQESAKKPKGSVEQPKNITNRRFKCSHCSRAFARKHDSERHARVHTGDKPYECPCCKKSFARSDALKRHIQIESSCRTSKEVISFTNSGRRRYKRV
ncbi:hypothetical protein G6F56_007381 [Rhizopus delemar]|nr:hypothetical protein G6F56_007381 [Rhizopus delemar]